METDALLTPCTNKRGPIFDSFVVDVYKITTIYISPVIVFFGLVGNFLSLAVMQKPNYSKSSLWVYVRYLAVCDTGFIAAQGLQRYVGHFVPLREILGSFFCKEFYYLSFVSAVSTCVGVTFMTADRFTAVIWPLRAAAWCTRRRAVATCTVISISLVILCSPQLTREMSQDANLSDRERCNMNPSWLETPMYIIFNIGLMSTPLVVGAMNIGIIVAIKRSRRERNQLAVKSKSQQESQTDVLLLIVSSFFCLCVMPYMIDWVAFTFFLRQETIPQLQIRRTSYEIVLLLASCNSSFNFYLYCFSSPAIRKDIRAMFCLCSKK
jgi:hypothetical protein